MSQKTCSDTRYRQRTSLLPLPLPLFHLGLLKPLGHFNRIDPRGLEDVVNLFQREVPEFWEELPGKIEAEHVNTDEDEIYLGNWSISNATVVSKVE